ncbi:MAG: VCBS repeat-containing protein [Polyangiaceae bacterium]
MDSGEDCDAFAPTSEIEACKAAADPDGQGGQPPLGTCDLICGAPGTINECRIIPDDTNTCAFGYNLGSDGVCRRPTEGAYSVDSLLTLDARGTEVLTPDLDGDGQKELVLNDLLGGTIRWVFLPDTISPSLPAFGNMAFGALTGPVCTPSGVTPDCDRSDDVVVPLFSALGVFLGSDRGVSPKVFASFPLPTDVLWVTGLPYPIAPSPGYLLPAFLSPSANGVEARFADQYTGQSQLVFDAPIDASAFAVTPEILALDPASDLSSLVATTGDAFAVALIDGSATLTVDTVPFDPANGVRSKRLIATNSPLYPEVAVTVSSGTGVSTRALRGPQPYTIVEGPVLDAPASSVLTVGYLNDDDILDYVTEDAVLVSLEGSFVVAAKPGVFGAKWNEAEVVDIDEDGVADVVAVRDRSIDILLGTNGFGFIPKHVTTQSALRELTVADFDGGGKRDVLVAERPNAATSAKPVEDCEETQLLFVSGESLDADTLAAGGSNIGTIQGLVATRVTQLYIDGALDAVPDLGLHVSCKDVNDVGVLAGATSGVLASPYLTAPFIELGPGSQGIVNVSVGIGDFTADGRNDVVATFADLTDSIRLKLQFFEGQGAADLVGVRSPGVDLEPFHALSAGMSIDGALLRIPSLAVGDVLPGAGDDVVLFGPQLDDPTTLTLVVANREGVQESLTVTQTQNPTGLHRVRLADFDFDGDIDVLALSVATIVGAPAYLFRNDDGFLQDAVTLLPPPDAPSEFFTDIAVGVTEYRSGVPERPVFLLTANGAFRCVVDTEAGNWTCARVAEMFGTTLFNIAINTLDVDRDGLDDLVISRSDLGTRGDTLVLRQCSANVADDCTPFVGLVAL